MTELLTAKQMRAIEMAAIASGEVTGLELMERAGCGVVEAIFEEWPQFRSAPQSVVIFCGSGNNGGDGFVVARLLHNMGWTVRVWLFGEVENLPPDARANHDAWAALGEVRRLDAVAFRRDLGAALYIDAVFGTGLSRAPEGELRDFLHYLGGAGGDGAHYQSRLVAIDAPSGLCLDSGRMLGGGAPFLAESSVPLCRLTVAFDSPKAGHFLADGPACCGKLKIVDIGLAKWRETTGGPVDGAGMSRKASLSLVERDSFVADRGALLPPERTLQKRGGHKFAHGHAVVLTGGAGKTGAARLAARGALRIGAGLVTLGVPGSAQLEVASAVTAVMLRRAGTPDELAGVLEDERINAVCLGPGLGGERARELVEVAMQHQQRSCVLDADALSAFEGAPEVLFAMLHKRCVMTPHGGEFARLFPDIAAKLAAPATRGPAYSRVDATREAAKRAGCVVLLKGADTVIASPDGQCSLNSAGYERAVPWLATAGSGDVLAGFITGLLARGFSAMTAAQAGAWLHVECARSFGPGLIAEDLCEELPKVFRALGM